MHIQGMYTKETHTLARYSYMYMDRTKLYIEKIVKLVFTNITKLNTMAKH